MVSDLILAIDLRASRLKCPCGGSHQRQSEAEFLQRSHLALRYGMSNPGTFPVASPDAFTPMNLDAINPHVSLTFNYPALSAA